MPARLTDIKRALSSMGVSIEPPNGGSHYRASKEGKMYPIPAHNGERSEIADVYIRGVCRAFDLNYEEFKKRL